MFTYHSAKITNVLWLCVAAFVSVKLQSVRAHQMFHTSPVHPSGVVKVLVLYLSRLNPGRISIFTEILVYGE